MGSPGLIGLFLLAILVIYLLQVMLGSFSRLYWVLSPCWVGFYLLVELASISWLSWVPSPIVVLGSISRLYWFLLSVCVGSNSRLSWNLSSGWVGFHLLVVLGSISWLSWVSSLGCVGFYSKFSETLSRSWSLGSRLYTVQDNETGYMGKWFSFHIHYVIIPLVAISIKPEIVRSIDA